MKFLRPKIICSNSFFKRKVNLCGWAWKKGNRFYYYCAGVRLFLPPEIKGYPKHPLFISGVDLKVVKEGQPWSGTSVYYSDRDKEVEITPEGDYNVVAFKLEGGYHNHIYIENPKAYAIYRRDNWLGAASYEPYGEREVIFVTKDMILPIKMEYHDWEKGVGDNWNHRIILLDVVVNFNTGEIKVEVKGER
jgi:hypothetical protein